MNSPAHDRQLLDLFRAAGEKERPPAGPHVADELELLTGWSLGTLTPAQAAELTRHLADCRACRDELAELLRAGVIDAPPAVADQFESAGDGHTVSAKIVEVAPPVVRLPRWRVARWQYALASAAAVLLMVGTWWTFQPPSPDAIIAQAEGALAAGDVSAAYDKMDILLDRKLPDETRDKAIGVWQRSAIASARDRLHRGEFSSVEQIGDKAARLGVKSAPLANLQLQAELKSKNDNALTHAGALLDYGYDVFGGQTRDVGSELSPAEIEKIKDGFTAAIKEHPDDFTLHLNFGQFLLTQNALDDARREFDRALALNPNDPAAQLGAGLVEFETNHPEAALDHFSKAIAADPKSVAAQINAALALERLNRDAEAAPHWRAAFDLSTDPKLRGELRPKVSPPKQ